MINDYFKLAVSNLTKRKLRSWLTMLGIFVSIAAIFTLISLSLGLQAAIQEQFRQLGTDKFFVQPKGNFGPGTTGAVELTTNDVDVIKKIAGIKRASYLVAGSVKMEFNSQTKFFPIYGIPGDGIDLYMESGSMKMQSGKMISDSSVKKVVLGNDYEFKSVFTKPVISGSKVLLNGVEFKVNGIIAPIGNPQDDKNIIININDFKEMFNPGERVDMILVQIDSGQNIDDVANTVEKKLMKFRNVDEKTIDFTILTPEQLLNSFGSILTIITAFLISVAGISLIVGAVGIANTMYTSVLERTKEIGVMKAIGARNSDILSIFVIESGLLGMIGGIIGVLLGILISKSVEYYAVYGIGTNLLQAALPVYLVVGCIGFSFVIGAVSGYLPARQASRVKPVDALRYE